MTMDGTGRGWTYGAEHEWADWDMRTPLPEGFGRDVKDYTIVNTNGVANDPTGRAYPFGGEINTPPTTTIAGQVYHLFNLKELLPEATVNHRSNLHLHIRVPGLKDDLEKLKQVQRYIHEMMPLVLPWVEPIPEPVPFEPGQDPENQVDPRWYGGAVRRYNRRKVSHHTLLTPKRLATQLATTTLTDFFEAEVPRSRGAGKPQWHFQPRLCVNLRQLLQTDTIEFRHFPGTLDEGELETCLNWCHDFLRAAFLGHDKDWLISFMKDVYPQEAFPKFPPYVHWREERYRMTCHDGTLSKAEIAKNIEAILAMEAIK